SLVTGGTRGIGKAISIALKESGYLVAANYGGNDQAAEAVSKATGIPVFKWDVSDYDACQKGVAAVTEAVGPVDILVNNAGITRDATLLKMTYAQWREVLDTHLTSCFNLSKAVFPGMAERKFGRIINIGSINGQCGQYGQCNYSAAKAGIHGF